MKTVWDRIHVWLAAHAPGVLASLAPGATGGQIRAAEEALGVTLPDDVRACYRIHDGQKAPEGFCGPPGFLYGWEWHSLEGVVSEWSCNTGLLQEGAFGDARGI